MLRYNCELQPLPSDNRAAAFHILWGMRGVVFRDGGELILPRLLFTCRGGHLALPDKGSVLVSRENGGNLLVNPLRDVWERGELTPAELTQWSFLVAAAGQAMLKVLPQLESGCINYWEAGNWALNFEAEPRGSKTALEHRRVHMHLLGRSRNADDPSIRWGEAPKFPDFANRKTWAANHERLTAEECRKIVVELEHILRSRYGFTTTEVSPWEPCNGCGYPMVIAASQLQGRCPECGDQSFGVCYLE
jgi:predicted Zn-ribbon and HTH transcriptional regulator